MGAEEQVRQLFEAVRKSSECTVRDLLRKNHDIDIMARDDRGMSLLECAERVLMGRRAECHEYEKRYESNKTEHAKRIAGLICPTVHSILKARCAYAKLAAQESQARQAVLAQRLAVPQAATQPGTVEACSVCSEPLGGAVALTLCGHRYHTACLMRWGRTPGGQRCPYCRANLETGAPEGSW